MKSNIVLNGDSFTMVKSLVLPGSFKKSERILRTVRTIIRRGRIDFDRLISRLNLADPLRCRFLSSFMKHIYASYDIKRLEQLYTEKSIIRKSFRPRARGRMDLIRYRKFRFVALLRNV